VIGERNRTGREARQGMDARSRTRPRLGLGSVVAAAAVTLVALAAGLYFSRSALDSYDALVMFAVTKSIVTTHTAYVPASFGWSSPHSSYGLGMSLLEVPAYLLGNRQGRDPQILVMLINPVLFALIVLVVHLWARAARLATAPALVVTLATGFGTMLLPYTQTGGSDVGTALGVAVVVLGVELTRRRVLTGSVVAGVGVSIAVLMRPDSAILVAPVAALAVALRSWRALPWFVLACAPGVLTTAAYSLLGTGLHYAGFTLREGFAHPFLSGLAGLLVSPARGVLLYVPVIVLAVAAVPWAWRRSPLVTGVCLALVLDRLLFYSGWFVWHGGWSWGPRFLLPAMPALAPLLLPFVQAAFARGFSWRRWAVTVAAMCVLAVSVGVQLLGAAVRYDTDGDNLAMTAAASTVHYPPGSDLNQVASSQVFLAALDGPMWDWRYFPIAEHAQKLADGRDLTGRRTRLSGLLEHQ
jgi:hypothetical protein